MSHDFHYELELVCQHPRASAYYEYSVLNRPDTGNAGFDLYCMDAADVTDDCVLLHLGVSARLLAVENGQATEQSFLLAPRSSIYKKGLLMANSVGIIDKSYRGELKAPVWSITKASRVEAGERLFQIVTPGMHHIKHVRIVDELPCTTRGSNGFGSSGR